MAWPLAVFPAELVQERFFPIEELLRAFLIVVVGQQEIEPVGERALHAELQRVVALLDAFGVPLLHGCVVRHRPQQVPQGDRSLIPQRAAHLVDRQELVERIRNLRA